MTAEDSSRRFGFSTTFFAIVNDRNVTTSTFTVRSTTTEQPWGWPWWGWFLFVICCAVLCISLAGAVITSEPARKKGEFTRLLHEESEDEEEADEEDSLTATAAE
mmetsp:Transcript_38849/g.91430  ORF Transcript_38849/g.91430 Transcript_38849/m.91430 type:complete len:105 (+) Transcript_38849:92-406(+)